MAIDGRFLYWGSGSIPCWRPMIVLKEKDLKYGEKLCNFGNKEHKSEEIMKLNARGQVPTFKDGDAVINESGAICDYLEFKYPDSGTCLLPKDPLERAKVLQRTYEIANLFKAFIEGIIFYIFFTPKEQQDEEVIKKKKAAAKEELQRWEEIMKQQGSGSFIAGKNFTMADVHIFPVLAWAVRGSANLENFPALYEYYERVSKRPSVEATWPPHWKVDTDKKDFFAGI